jgi:hypothetical protein
VTGAAVGGVVLGAVLGAVVAVVADALVVAVLPVLTFLELPLDRPVTRINVTTRAAITTTTGMTRVLRRRRL